MRRIFLFLFTLYLYALAFTKGLPLPVLGRQPALPELLFLLCLPVAIAVLFRKQRVPLRWTTVDTLIALLCLSTVASAALHPTRAAWLEVAIRVYLFAVYGLTRLVLTQVKCPEDWFRLAFSRLGLITAATVGFSWMLLFFFDGAGLELTDPKYFPVRGILPRIEAFMMSPNQLANLLILCTLVLLGAMLFQKKRGWETWLGLLFLVAALLSTLSKSLVLLGAGILLLLSMKKSGKAPRFLFLTAAGALLLFFLFNTSYLLLPRQAPDLERVLSQNYVTGDTIEWNGQYLLAESSILRLKKMAWDMFRENPVFGVGPGNFRDALREYQQRGDYPVDRPLYDPHSTWFGALAEQGLVGLLLLLLFFGYLFRKGAGGLKSPVSKEHSLQVALLVFFLLMAVEGWAMDVLNFRHFWVGVGVWVGISHPPGQCQGCGGFLS